MKKVLQAATALLLSVAIACGGGDPNIDTAKLNLKNKQYDKALEAVDAAIQATPDNAYAYYYRGNIYLEWAKATADVSARTEKYSAMREAWKKVSEINAAAGKTGPESILISTAVRTQWGQEHNKAIELAGVDNPTPEALTGAVSHLRNALAIKDSSLSAYVLGEVYLMAGDTANTTLFLSKSLEMGGVNYAYGMRLVAVYGQTNNHGARETLLLKLKETFPDSIGIVQELANTYLSTGNIDRAIETVKTLIDKDPSNANYHLVYGTQVYQAVIDLSNSIRKDFDNIFELRRRLNRAKAAARNAPPPPKPVKGKAAPVATGPDSVAIVSNILAETEAGVIPKKQRMGELDAITLAEMKIVVELDPSNHAAYNVMGIVFQNRAAVISSETQSLDALAKDYYERADELDAKAKDTLRESLPFYEKAAELKPENKDYWNSLFRIYTNLNMMDKANEAYDKANQ